MLKNIIITIELTDGGKEARGEVLPVLRRTWGLVQEVAPTMERARKGHREGGVLDGEEGARWEGGRGPGA